jgi:tetratricopeptide (TPR) repeat protein
MKLFVIVLAFIIFCASFAIVWKKNEYFSKTSSLPSDYSVTELNAEPLLPQPLEEEREIAEPLQPAIPTSKVLPSSYHVYQSFNNCGPAALSMALAQYGMQISQQELGMQLRPFQNPQGDNDDKSTTLDELALKAEELGFVAYHRPNGNYDLLTHFIANDMPIITRTWLKTDDDIGHYRVIKGYDLSGRTLIQDDSLQGQNLMYSEDEFNAIWKQFGYEFLVLVPQEKVDLAKDLLGDLENEENAWENALKYWQTQVAQKPNDIHTRFNLAIAYYKVGDFQSAISEFEKVQNSISWRALWYNMEPIKAYQQAGQYEKVFEITDTILNNHNRAYSELYIIRGEIYKEQGNIESARAEFEKAVFYNSALKSAQDALDSL